MKADQRQALATLTKAQLRELADAFDLDAASNLLKDDLVDLLARSRRASFEKILGQLKRDDLKAICRARRPRRLGTPEGRHRRAHPRTRRHTRATASRAHLRGFVGQASGRRVPVA